MVACTVSSRQRMNWCGPARAGCGVQCWPESCWLRVWILGFTAPPPQEADSRTCTSHALATRRTRAKETPCSRSAWSECAELSRLEFDLFVHPDTQGSHRNTWFSWTILVYSGQMFWLRATVRVWKLHTTILMENSTPFWCPPVNQRGMDMIITIF